ncbi:MULTISPECIES: rhodanese-like domain-containing protein [unclassified Virgibacillus]|uniref:rhodanese-like domain-containing protein n=1 Tax=unclassified Virgibacillus TaxID=2620237 RepID=UPI0024DE59E1|nr:rhodanese-like domain-containing protein [Virgibacillus sp. LDC-1]
MKEISTSELAERLKTGANLSIIDVREDDEVAQGKVPGAYHIRLSEIPERLDEIDKQTVHYLVCRSGGRSGRACEFLQANGYQVINVKGGMLAWDEAVEKTD